LDLLFKILGELLGGGERLLLDRAVLLDRVLIDQDAAHREDRNGNRQAIKDQPLGEGGRRACAHERPTSEWYDENGLTCRGCSRLATAERAKAHRRCQSAMPSAHLHRTVACRTALAAARGFGGSSPAVESEEPGRGVASRVSRKFDVQLWMSFRRRT